MPTDKAIGFPVGSSDESELLLSWLGYLRGAVLRKLTGISDEQARWRPDGALISLLGIVNHRPMSSGAGSTAASAARAPNDRRPSSLLARS